MEPQPATRLREGTHSRAPSPPQEPLPLTAASSILHPPGRPLVRLLPHRHLLRLRHRRGLHGQDANLLLQRVPHLGPLPARLGDRHRLRLGQPRRRGDHGHVRQRGEVRPADLPLLLDRRHPGHAVPGAGHDALLLRLQGPLRAGVHAQALRQHGAPDQRDRLRPGPAAHRRGQPLPAGLDHQPPAGLAAVGGAGRGRRHRLLLHQPRRAVGGHLQRGPAVLRHYRGPAPPDPAGPAPGGLVGGAHREGHPGGVRGPGHLRRPRRPAPLLARSAPVRLRLPRPVGDRHRLRPGLRALLRLLDHQLRGGAARHGGGLHLLGALGPDHRHLRQDAGPVPGDHPRHGGRRPGQGGHRPQAADHRGHRGPGRQRHLQRRRPAAHARRAAQRAPGPGDHRPAGLLHGRYGSQYLRLQHGVHRGSLRGLHQ